MGGYDTLWTMANYLRQHVPEAELGLCQTYVKDAYRELLSFPTDTWSFLLRQSQFICQQSITGNCYAIQGSTLIQNIVASNGMAAFTINAAGTGYAVNDLWYPIGYSGGLLTVTSINGSGGITGASITNAGANFCLATGVPTYTSGSGTGATLNVTQLGAGVLPGLPSIIAGRQAIFQGEWPCYDIVDNPSSTTFTLATGYGGVTGTVAFEITNVYWTPSDSSLERILCLTDPPNGCQLPTSFTMEELNNVDPQRSQAGTPYLLADVDLNVAYLAALPIGVTDSYGQTNASQPVLRKELYPRQQTNYAYPFFYKIWAPDLTPANPNPMAYFARRGDIIKKRAMAELALWEGPAILGRRANPVLHNIHMADYRQMAQDLQMKDASIMQRNYSTYLGMTKYPFPDSYYGSSFAQTHPALTSDVGLPFVGGFMD